MIIGVPAFNERLNIGRLLDSLLECCRNDSRIGMICVISSSTDKTNDVVRHYSSIDPRVILLTEKQRRGKTSAWNELMRLSETERFDALVYMGADNLPGRGAISLLLDQLKGKLGLVGARPVAVDRKNCFLGWYAHLQWNIHHLVNQRVKPKVSGEMCAMRVGVVREMPPGLINDDAYLERLFEIRGFDVAYCPQAIVYLKGPSTVSDLIRQRRRIYIGHHQLRMYTGQKPSTIWYSSLKLLREAMPSRGPRQWIYLILSIFLQALIYLIAKADFFVGNLPYKWRMAASTKALRFGI